MKAAEWAKDHWPEIIGTLVGTEYVDGKHHPCPNGNGTDCFRFSNINGRGNFFCKCSEGDKDGFDLIQCAHSTNFPGAVELVETVIGERPRDPEERPVRQSYAETLRSEVSKTPRSLYLESRGLILPPGLDWHAAVDYRADGEVIAKYPAMLAPVSRDGRFLTYHVTYIEQGSKAPVPAPRKILPAHVSLKGSAVHLWPAGRVLGIAEGIETAIAAHMLFDLPVWSALNTSLLKSWRSPPGTERVVVFGDNDENHAGQAAAFALAHRLHGTVEVEIQIPDKPGDWNDVLIEQKEQAA